MPPKKQSSAAKANKNKETYRRRRERLAEKQLLLYRKENAERERKTRSQLPEEEQVLCRQSQAARRKERRDRLTEEQLLRIRKENAERQRKRRSQLPEEEQVLCRQSQAARRKERRDRLTEEQLLRIRKENAERARKRRSQLSEEKQLLCRQAHAARRREKKARLSQEQLLLIRKELAEQERRRLARLTEEEVARQRKANVERKAKKRDNEKQEMFCLLRADHTTKSKEHEHRKLATKGLTFVTNPKGPKTQTVTEIQKLQISVTSLRKATLELIRSCVESAVSAKYGPKPQGGLLKTSTQRRIQRKTPTKTGTCKKKRPSKNSYKELFPIPTLIDSQQCICIVCKEEFNSERSLTGHLSMHSVSELFVAKEKHMNTPISDSRKMKIQYKFLTVHKCELCSDHCYSLTKYRRHIIEKHRENREFVGKNCFPCSFCDEIFIQRNSLVVHQRDFHGIFTQCPICKENFESQELFAKHLNEKHSNYFKKDEIVLEYNDGFFCKICGHCNINSRHVFSHCEEVHSDIAVVQRCTICKQNYDTKTALKYHINKAHTEKLFCCELCGNQFKDERALRTHKITHTSQPKNKVECKECGKDFASRNIYKVHFMSVHQNKRAYQCSICQKTFTTPTNLHMHKITVCEKEKAKAKDCPTCGKTFDNYILLSYHKTNIHKFGNIEEDTCHLCKKTFKSSLGLLFHSKNCHVIRTSKHQLKCAICEKSCPGKQRLLIHWRMHQKEKPYKCSLCEAPFKYGYQFYAHRKKDHENEIENAKIITDKEMDNKIKEDCKNAHATQLAELKNHNRQSTSETLIDSNSIQRNDRAGKASEFVNADQIADTVILTDSLEGIHGVSETNIEITFEESTNFCTQKDYVDFSRANVPVLETKQLAHQDLSDIFDPGENSTHTSDKNSEEAITPLQEVEHSSELLDDPADDISDIDHPSSPIEYSGDDFNEEEKKPMIFGQDEDPFDRRLIVELERLRECLVCQEVFYLTDLYDQHMNSKSHRATMRAHKKEPVLIVKNEKIKLKYQNEEISTSYRKDVHTFLSCPLCSEELASLKKYRQHSLAHEREAYCLLCTGKFLTVQNLVDHYISEHDGKNIVKCEDCDMAFLEYQERHLKEHMRDTHCQKKNKISHKISLITCDICGEDIKGTKLFWIHLLTHNADEYKCVHCDEKLQCLNDLQCHYNEAHNGEMPFSCESCPHKFSTQFQLNAHEKEDHAKKGSKKIMRTQKKNKETDMIFPCPFCDLKFTSLKKYNSHTIQHRKIAECLLCTEKFHIVRKLVDHYISEHNGENIVKCKVCDKGFLEYKPKNLREHMTYTHGKKYHKKENKKLYTCHLCGEIMKKQRLFRDHLLSHNDTRHKCFYCLKEFNQIELEKHYTNAHNGEIPFSCGVCQQKFSTEERLKLHEKEFHPEEKNNEHSTKNKYVCDECGKGFKSKSEITDHKLTHVPLEDRNKFFCEFCAKSFFKSQSLTIHIREHTGEKPYPCKDCDMAFASPALLKQHVDCSHNQNSQTCELCGKSFNRRKNLVHHIKVHHSNVEKPSISCELCSEKFTKAEFLKKHLETLHDPSRPFGCDQCSCRFNHKSNVNLHKKGVHEKMGTVYPKKKKSECA